MSKKASTNSSQQGSGTSGPWSPAVKPLKNFLTQIQGFGGIGATDAQKQAFEQLRTNAAQGDPYAAQTNQLARDAFASPDRTGMVGDAYSTLQGQLGDYASGKYLDPMSNPQMQAMLTQVGDEAANRVNAQFAGAGRDLSGANQMAVGKGVTQATLPLLLDQYNRAQDQQMSAAQSLYGAGTNAATTMGGLDQLRQALRAQGIDFGKAGTEADNRGANATLDLEQQLKGMPYEDAALYASLLFPMAGLGSTSSMNSTGKATTKMPINLFSDARVKEDIAPVGKLADGTNIYRYKYIDDPAGTTHIGVMAQEVEGRNPEAVTENEAGIKMVNYDAATKKAAEVLKARREGNK